MTRASWIDILLLNNTFFNQGEDGLRDFCVSMLQVKIKFRLKFFNPGWFSISFVS